ncbi:MAG TPA: molybdopterin dinucleotide binding domain-containing protein, partial [Kofleriaceae bacterium]|nr:molybdopterin dinucleotide binding domain-containing protein [Kofleriaceae bacterium]
FGTLASWLVDVVNVLTGHLDEPGGAMFPKAAAFAANTMGTPGKGKGVTIGRRMSRVSNAPEVFGELPMTCLAEEIETPGDGQVRALVTLASNPVLSSPNGPRLAAAMGSLDFMVSVDIYRNETTRHADVILPGCSPLEDSHFDVAFPQLAYRNACRYSPQLVARDRPAEWEVLLRLNAIARGRSVDGLDDELVAEDVRRVAGPMAETVLAQVASRTGPERLLDLALRAGPYRLTLDQLIASPDGIDLGPLDRRIPEVLRTPSGMIELAPPLLLADLDRAAADLATPVPDLLVIGRRQLRSNNSWMHNLSGLASGKFRCTALVHPIDAQRLGLANGGRATIRSETGAIDVQVEISDAIMPGVVSVPHGWGHDQPDTVMTRAASRPGANLNAVLDDRRRDPLSGNAVLSGAIEMTPH